MYNLGVLLANQLDPPDLPGARTWYNGRRRRAHPRHDNLGVLLANQLDPPDLPGARTWYERAADAGNTDAANNLGVLLATCWTRRTCPGPHLVRTAADAGNTDAMLGLGELCLQQYDVAGARAAWQPLLDKGPSESAASAAVNLAPVLAIGGLLDQAAAALRVAIDSGVTEAADYVAILDNDDSVREAARDRLAAMLPENTDALNFLGVGALTDSDTETARRYWVRSTDQEDLAAPVLLRISGLDRT